MKKPGYMEKCLETAEAVFKAVMRKYNMTSKSVVALTDYSNYGSYSAVSCKVGSAQNVCDQAKKKIRRHIGQIEVLGDKNCCI